MTLALHHRLALAAAVAASGLALTDAVTHGVTGDSSPFSEGSDLTAVVVMGALVHGLAYTALAVVLVREASRFRSVNRVARGARWVVLVSLALLSVGFLLIAPVVEVGDADDSWPEAIFGIVAGTGFAGPLLGSTVLGLALLRTGRLGTGARVLALMLPALAVTLLLAWLNPAWAHPAYLETVAYVGLALLGVGVRPVRPTTGATLSSPASA